jgi:hypothetical protein
MSINLEQMTMKSLKQVAKDLAIPNYSKWRANDKDSAIEIILTQISIKENLISNCDDDIDTANITTLKKFAKALGVKKVSKVKKADIEIIREAIYAYSELVMSYSEQVSEYEQVEVAEEVVAEEQEAYEVAEEVVEFLAYEEIEVAEEQAEEVEPPIYSRSASIEY